MFARTIPSARSVIYVGCRRNDRVIEFLTLHMPAPPDHVVHPDLVLPSQPDPFEPIPLRRCQFLSGTNSNAHTSYPLQNVSPNRSIIKRLLGLCVLPVLLSLATGLDDAD